MIDSTQLREHIIIPVLKELGHFSLEAEEILVMTVATESDGGKYVKQLGGGPAVGPYQMEPETHDDIWNHYLEYQEGLANKILGFAIEGGYSSLYDFDKARPKATQMAGNLYYATAMARAHYLRVSEPIPRHNHKESLAAYYKEYWNTYEGDATIEKTLNDYESYLRV